MYLIDTNVVSESRKIASGKADPAVINWLSRTDPSTTFISAMTLFELELGVGRVERRDPAQGSALRRWLDRTVKPGFQGRVLPMDSEIAVACAGLHIPDPAGERDAWIAATALVHGLTLVTRNVRDFAASRVATLNPWDAQL
ncbi:MAG: hypothetical protein JWM33_1153 [Caulobacteraceae bacterium]|nr:hypothetical protein [Caulobacteraceae bacterium]